MKMTMEQARNFSGQMLDNPKKFYAWYDKERARQIRTLDSLSVDPEDDLAAFECLGLLWQLNSIRSKIERSWEGTSKAKEIRRKD